MSLTTRAITNLGLSSDQVQVVNSVVRTTEGDYLQLERDHGERSVDADGHVHVVIRPFQPADMAEIEKLGERFWKELSGVLTPAQLDSARALGLERGLFPAAQNRFGPSRAVTTVEMWRDRAGNYHYMDTMSPTRGGETITTNSGPNINLVIPPRFRVYWTEPK
jgi:hypothetical protein